MFLPWQPSPHIIQRLLTQESQQPFSYPMVGATEETPPQAYAIDHNRRRLGVGSETFLRAKAALQRWEMFNLGWVQIYWPDAPLEPGVTVAVLGKALGLWSLNACRIVYTIDETGPVERFGFAYGTLSEHLASGEERFTIEWRHQDDSVWYDILAFSQPQQLLARLGYPIIRRLQKRFARESMARMEYMVNSLERANDDILYK